MPSAISTAISQTDYDRLKPRATQEPLRQQLKIQQQQKKSIFVLKPYSFDSPKMNKSFVALCRERYSKKTFRA